MDVIGTMYTVSVIIVMAISGWWVTRQVRRRMKKTLGRNPSDLELASLKTWMQVEQDEQVREASKPIHPE
jgi:uncharacterized protein YneF (UPF0154 family)